VFNRVVHDWDDERARRILESYRQAMAPTADMLVVYQVIPDGNEPHPGSSTT
jgi:O-methyltransferase domain